MDRLTVIVPVKGRNPKSRLREILGVEERRQLVLLMIQDLLKTIDRAGLLSNTYVVSPDEGILRFAGKCGAKEISEREERGVNAAVELAMRETNSSERWFIIPGDIPFASEEDIARVLYFSGSGSRIVISPSRTLDGTNLLLMRRQTSIELSYDRDSFRNHIAAAAHSRFPLAVYCSSRVMLDIDTVDDVKVALESRITNTTASFLDSKFRGGVPWTRDS